MVGDRRTLADRLATAGVSAGTGPWDAWVRLHAAEGTRATVIDLYELVTAPQGADHGHPGECR